MRIVQFWVLAAVSTESTEFMVLQLALQLRCTYEASCHNRGLLSKNYRCHSYHDVGVLQLEHVMMQCNSVITIGMSSLHDVMHVHL